jgi:DNA repair ATPase RecN
MSKFTYSGKLPKPDIIGEILKRLEKIDLKLDNIEQVQKLQGEEIKEIKERITNIEQVQKLQGEEIKEIKEVQKAQGEKLDKLENKLDTVIVLNNLKTE